MLLLQKHITKKSWQPTTSLHQDVYLILLLADGANSKCFDFSKNNRQGIMPIFFTKKGILIPQKGQIPFKTKYKKGHPYTNPEKFYITVLNKYLKKYDWSLVKNADNPIINNNHNNINLIPHYGANFGHQLCVYLSIIDKIPSSSKSNIIIYPTYPHINELIKLLLPSNRFTPITKVNTVYFFHQLQFLSTKYYAFPNKYHYNVIHNNLLLKIPKPNNNPTKIAIVKSNNCKLIGDNTNKYKGSFDSNIKEILSSLNFQCIDHESLSFNELLTIIKNCKQIILSWGAIAYYAIFLQPHQKCLTLLHQDYAKQYERYGPAVCFDSKLYSNFTISPPFPSSLTQQELSNLIDKHFTM